MLGTSDCVSRSAFVDALLFTDGFIMFRNICILDAISTSVEVLKVGEVRMCVVRLGACQHQIK